MNQDVAERLKIISNRLNETVTKPGANGILQEAGDALVARAKLRDSPGGERSAWRAADILTAWTGRKHSELDIWRTLLAVKLAREAQGGHCRDDYVDLAGYAALLGECSEKAQD